MAMSRAPARNGQAADEGSAAVCHEDFEEALHACEAPPTSGATAGTTTPLRGEQWEDQRAEKPVPKRVSVSRGDWI